MRPVRPLHLSFLLLLISHTLQLHGQVLPLRYYTTRDGLVSNTVRCITQDSFGYLWIGTTEGVSVFDGIAFRNLSILEGLSNSNVNWMAESGLSPGTMWIATNGGGICQVSRESTRVIPLPGGQLANRVNMVEEDDAGRIWCATDRGVVVITAGRAEQFHPELNLQEVVGLHQAGGGTLHVVTFHDILEFPPGPGGPGRIRIPYVTDEILTCAAFMPGGDVWVGSSAGRLVRIGGGAVEWEMALGAGNHLTSIHRDHDGVLRVGSYNGVFTLDPDGTLLGRSTTEQGLQETSITAIQGDREGNVWFGGFTGGLSVLGDTPVLRFPFGGPLLPANDASIVIDRDNRAWALTPDGLLEIRKEPSGAWKSARHRIAGLRDGTTPRELFYDAGRHGLWVSLSDNTIHFYGITSAERGPSIIAGKRILEPGKHFPVGNVQRVILGPDGSLFIAVFKAGLCIVDPWNPDVPRILLTGKEHGVPESDIRAIVLDRSGSLWLGGYLSGVVRMVKAGGAWTIARNYSTADLLTDNSVRVLFEDPRGRIWVGTRYGGITIIDGDSADSVTVREGLLSNAVWSIAMDPAGSVWVGTQAGLQPVDPDSLTVGSRGSDLPRMIVQACVVDSRRIVWAYGWGEVVLFDAGHPRLVKPPPPIHITGLSVDGIDVSPAGSIDLSSWRSNLTVEFSGISLSNPEAVRYVYMLEGVDRDWQPPTRSRTLSFATLRPGEYRLLIKALNADGVGSVEPADLRFSIPGPLWQRWWFILAAATALSGLGYLLYRNRVSRMRSIERVRSRIATDLHDDIGSDLTQIAILSEVVRAKPGAGDNAELLEKIGIMARRAIAGMSDLVWYIDPRHDRVADLVDRIRDIAGGLLAGGEVSFAVVTPPEIRDLALPPELRKDLLLTLKEGLTNAVRHSGCSWIRVAIRKEGSRLVIVLEDDGRGFARAPGREGHGLVNMQTRIAGLGGTLSIGPAAPTGTTLRIEVPVG